MNKQQQQWHQAAAHLRLAVGIHLFTTSEVNSYFNNLLTCLHHRNASGIRRI